MTLVLELRPREKFIADGIVLSFENKTRILVHTHVPKFLFGKQIMEIEQATTPLKNLYLAIQSLYVRYPLSENNAKEIINSFKPQNQDEGSAISIFQQNGDQLALLRQIFKLIKMEQSGFVAASQDLLGTIEPTRMDHSSSHFSAKTPNSEPA